MDSITTKILHREWTFKCPSEEKDKLSFACLELDHEMQKINTAGAATGYDNIALLAALNSIYKLQNALKQSQGLTSIKKTLTELRAELNDELKRLEQYDEAQ